MKTAAQLLDEQIARIAEKATTNLAYAQAKLELERARETLETAERARVRALFQDAAERLAKQCGCGNPLCQVREIASWLRFYGDAVTDPSEPEPELRTH